MASRHMIWPISMISKNELQEAGAGFSGILALAVGIKALICKKEVAPIDIDFNKSQCSDTLRVKWATSRGRTLLKSISFEYLQQKSSPVCHSWKMWKLLLTSH